MKAQLKRCYDQLHLKINESKSAVASAVGRNFLGCALWAAQKGEVKRAVSKKALETFRHRQLTRRSGGCSIGEVIEKLRPTGDAGRRFAANWCDWEQNPQSLCWWHRTIAAGGATAALP